MKIISWNVNGIRAVAKKGFKEFVEKYSPDILCIQETKAFEDQFIKELGGLEGYRYVWHTGTRAGYAGTAIFYKQELKVLDTKNHFGEIEHFHEDGRITEVEFDNFVLLNGYYPNGGTRADGTEMVDYKLEFYDHIISYANKLVKEGKNIVLTGDFNICHTEIDIARPKENENSIGFLPVERAKVGELLDNGYIDTFRYKYPSKTDTYSWWSYRAGARPRNVGWRIDYFVVNNGFIDKILDTTYLTEEHGSDHCPIMLELK
ncbi:MAG: exodeoxyribonuclease III [Candidatus Gracilibacteria bacterium]|nr:exodeoxyribonuclease III [Candidatus Gracilibacteria bacterium]